MTSDTPEQPQQPTGAPEPAPQAPSHEPAAGDEDALRSQHLDLDTLSAYLDQQLPPEELAAIRSHLATCPECGRELAELRATVALLRELPRYAPRRSFQLGPEHARRVARGVPAGPGGVLAGWFERLVPALPALRIATAAVAVLLVAVIAGDLVTNREAPPVTVVPTGGEAVERANAPESQPAPAMQAPPPAEEAPASEGFMPRSAAVPTTEVVLDDAAGGQPAAEIGTEPEAPASLEEEDSAEDAPGVISPEPAAPAPPPSVSGWRLAQVGLGLALVWLIVSLAGVAWLRRDRDRS